MSDEYVCKKCGDKFPDLNTFRGHNLRCKGIEEEPEKTEEPEPEKVVRPRRERTPLGGIRRKLSFPNQDPAYVYRWINDKGNRLNDAADGGYEYVMQSEGKAGDESKSDQGMDSRVSKVVMTNDDGTPRRGYLMRIKREWYDEDQRKKQQYLDDIEAQLKRGVDAQGRPGQDGRYIPKSGGISINRGG